MAKGKGRAAANPEAAIGAAMLDKLALLRADGGNYPLTLGDLARAAAPDARAQQVLAAARKRSFSSRAIVARAGRIDAPVAAFEDLGRLAGAAITLEFALRSMRTETIHARTVSDLGSRLTSTAKFKDVFKRLVSEQVAREQTPATVGWIVDRRPKLFLLEEIRPQSLRHCLMAEKAVSTASDQQPPLAAPSVGAADFAGRFEEAFDQLDRQKGSHNFVSLLDLRRRLAEFPRDTFDAGLVRLRIDGRFTLSGAESRYGIRQEEREAGLEEAGTLLLHVSRKVP